MSNPDRRRAQRIALQQVVCVVLGDGGYEVLAVTENFSSDGVLLYADQLIPEGSEAGLILALPRTAESCHQQASAKSRVVGSSTRLQSAHRENIRVRAYALSFYSLVGAAGARGAEEASVPQRSPLALPSVFKLCATF